MPKAMAHPEFAPVRVGVRVDKRVLDRLHKHCLTVSTTEADTTIGVMIDAALTSYLDAVDAR